MTCKAKTVNLIAFLLLHFNCLLPNINPTIFLLTVISELQKKKEQKFPSTKLIFTFSSLHQTSTRKKEIVTFSLIILSKFHFFFPIMKKQRCSEKINLFDLLSEEIVFIILDCLNTNPFDKKSFSLVCKSFYITESKHRKKLKPLRPEHLPAILIRYSNTTHLDLSLCPRINDYSLSTISKISSFTLQSIDLSCSGGFSTSGLLSLTLSCKNLKEIDVSNAVSLKDAGAAALAEAKNLEKLWMGRCKMVTDMGVGCIAVGCKNLKLISLKWCLGVGDLGVGLIAVKCKEVRSLDLSYLPVIFSFVF